jgi:hypothetical protein
MLFTLSNYSQEAYVSIPLLGEESCLTSCLRDGFYGESFAPRQAQKCIFFTFFSLFYET